MSIIFTYTATQMQITFFNEDSWKYALLCHFDITCVSRTHQRVEAGESAIASLKKTTKASFLMLLYTVHCLGHNSRIKLSSIKWDECNLLNDWLAEEYNRKLVIIAKCAKNYRIFLSECG